MSIITMPEWVNRKRVKPNEEHATWEWEKRAPLKLPDDMMHELDRALAEERFQPPLGTPVRTAQTVSDEINRLQHELANARELVKAGEAKEATLVAELKAKIDEEIAAKKAAHDAEVAELEGLRPSTGETA